MPAKQHKLPGVMWARHGNNWSVESITQWKGGDLYNSHKAQTSDWEFYNPTVVFIRRTH